MSHNGCVHASLSRDLMSRGNMRKSIAWLISAAVWGGVEAAMADQWVRYWGVNTPGGSFCEPDVDRIRPFELVALSMGGEGLILGTGSSQNGARRGWGSNASGVYAWPPSSSGVDAREFPDPSATSFYYHTQVSLGSGFAAAIADGPVGGWYAARTVVCWGLNDLGQCDVPLEPSGFPLHQIIQVSCGLGHTIALRSNGQVRGWGLSSYGQSAVPPSLRDGLPGVVSVAAGGLHSMALRGDGSVACWGAGSPSDAVDDFLHCGQSAPPSSLSSVTDVAAGGLHSAALRTDGSVVCWGAGSFEPTFNFNTRQSMVPANLGPCTRISASLHATAALQADGVVRVWGWQQSLGQCTGQCDVPDTVGTVSSMQSTMAGILTVSDQSRPPCPADISPSCTVDAADLSVLLASWGSQPPGVASDLNDDGVVEGKDLAILLSAWGPCSP
jgi:alpha-tubulin suppressor-like RCC1 family protein